MEFTLFNYYRSSASYRVRIALALKGIEYEYKAVSLIKGGGEQYSEEYKKLNPLSQVPCFVHGDKAISQSMAIIDYLEQVRAEPPLFPKNPFKRALVIQLCEIINSGIQPLHNLTVTNELEANYDFIDVDSKRWRKFWIERGMKSFEEMLNKTAGKYCVGDELTAADCFLVPQMFSGERFGADMKQFKLASIVNDRLLNLEAVQKAHPAKQPDAV